VRALVIGIGNPLRRDDGAARQVLEWLGNAAEVSTLVVQQLTPEIAADIAGYDAVVFVDADVSAKCVRIEPLRSARALSPLTHVARPAEIAALARNLFRFSGRAYTCHIPVGDLAEGEGLSRRTEAFAQQAARQVVSVLASLTAGKGETTGNGEPLVGLRATEPMP
jgi:hydrogenase maturation protease